MKKFSFIVIILVVAKAFFAQKNSAPALGTYSVEAPKSIVEQFSKDYPDMKPVWSMDGSNYRAEFMKGNLKHAITYDPAGRWLNHEDQLAMESYPAAIAGYHTKHYPDKPYQVWSNTDANGNLVYFTVMESESIWFDKSGNFKEKKKIQKAKPGRK